MGLWLLVVLFVVVFVMVLFAYSLLSLNEIFFFKVSFLVFNQASDVILNHSFDFSISQ
jgi:hypothetical protein